MKLSQCKYGTIVETTDIVANQAVGMIVGLSQISNTPAPLVKFSHLEEPIPFLPVMLKLYEE